MTAPPPPRMCWRAAWPLHPSMGEGGSQGGGGCSPNLAWITTCLPDGLSGSAPHNTAAARQQDSTSTPLLTSPSAFETMILRQTHMPLPQREPASQHHPCGSPSTHSHSHYTHMRDHPSLLLPPGPCVCVHAYAATPVGSVPVP